ncbi:glycoside hydrolase family 5 protein [Suillus subaureus]|uniref:Glycoside hydrolase family 5 protein n=1 Tax=Suillus subaureus TaxID=48587 RepID=A0A9P7E216_9AGAM|nr:glycoside hydrolase family 5 protein [Suillus subaureus]KAG1808935.1 glycoside hydrolase family 5 protein [Suillus subaureus]
MKHILAGLVLSSTFVAHAWAGQPAHIYGVNLGSWLVLEPWMLPQEWLDMGGQECETCSSCIASELSFAKVYPDAINTIFAKHWDTWFMQDDVNTLKVAGINTIRVPLGYWIVEALVDRLHELYPQGGFNYLHQGLSWLKDARIQVILDHHTLPRVQIPGQMFTGNCTTDVQFYTPYNYHHTLVWTAVMTVFSHLAPDFESVFVIEAVNDPITDATKTPDYGTFQKNFVQMIHAIELTLGISVPSSKLFVSVSPSISNNFTAALIATFSATGISAEVQGALLEAVVKKSLLGYIDDGIHSFMDVNYQYNNPSNPADMMIGPQAYDNHGIAAPDPMSYMTSICNFKHIQADAAVGNSPLWFREWGLSTQFDATDKFLCKWADTQKLAYSKSAGWIVCVQLSTLARQWSYLEGLKLGFLTQDPAVLHDLNVCIPYVNSTSDGTSS